MAAVKIQESSALEVARLLLDASAIRLNTQTPFTWSSGWKSPIYCDNRIALSHPQTRTTLRNELIRAIRSHFPEAEAIAGVATAGIAQGALVADGLQLPFLYVRPKPKDHGMENLIEGRLTAGQRVVVVEDLVSTGGSSLKAVHALRDAGAVVVGMVAIFTYGFEIAAKNFAEAKVTLVCLSDYDHLLSEALARKVISGEQHDRLKVWRTSPDTWGR
jgi:orotate phosphoribosyltransferase